MPPPATRTTWPGAQLVLVMMTSSIQGHISQERAGMQQVMAGSAVEPIDWMYADMLCSYCRAAIWLYRLTRDPQYLQDAAVSYKHYLDVRINCSV